MFFLGDDEKLKIAIEKNKTEKVKKLISKISSTSLLDEAFKWAIEFNSNADIIKALLDNGANVDLDIGNFSKENRYLEKPLHIAAKNGNVDIAETLIVHNADLNSKIVNYGQVHYSYESGDSYEDQLGKYHGYTPLDMALEHQNSEIVKVMLLKNAEFCVKHGVHISKDLEDLVESGTKEFISFLLSNWKKIGFNNKSEVLNLLEDLNLLEVAIRRKRKDLIDVFIDFGVNIKKFGTIKTAFQIGDFELAKWFHAQGSIIPESSLLDLITYCNEESANFLFENGAGINFKNDQGITPFHNAIECGNEEGVKFLLSKGVNWDLIKKNPAGILNNAAKWNLLDIVKNLISLGIDVNSIYSYGNTPLHLAAIYNSQNVAEFLMENGAKGKSLNKYFHDPIFIAGCMGHMGVINVLKRNGIKENAEIKHDLFKKGQEFYKNLYPNFENHMKLLKKKEINRPLDFKQYVLPKEFKCPKCNNELELNGEERINKKFKCPACNKLVKLKEKEIALSLIEDKRDEYTCDDCSYICKTTISTGCLNCGSRNLI